MPDLAAAACAEAAEVVEDVLQAAPAVISRHALLRFCRGRLGRKRCGLLGTAWLDYCMSTLLGFLKLGLAVVCAHEGTEHGKR